MSVQKEESHEEGNSKECVCNDGARALVDPRSRILRRVVAHRRDPDAPRDHPCPMGVVMYGQMYGQEQ